MRGVTVRSSRDALANAGTLIEIERTLGLFHEAQVQAVLRGLHARFSIYYMLGFAPLIVGLLFWLALRQRDRYRELRTLLLLSVGAALVIHVAYPVAPPRLIPELGITDTVGLSTREASVAGVRFNPYAAMPSMHVGWSLLVGVVAGFRAARLLVVRVLFAGQPALMTIAVTATGNHFFLDSVAGAGVALGSMALAALARSADELGLTCRAGSVRLARTRTGTGALPGSPLRVSHTLEESRCPPARFRAGRLVPGRP